MKTWVLVAAGASVFHGEEMLPSVLTAFLFAASGISGRRAALGFGALRANSIRLALAALILGCWVVANGPPDFSTRVVRWLLVSGAIGFGLGDVCLFLAYPRIGARLALLVNFCSAPLFGAAFDWWLQATALTMTQLFTSLVILAGVGMALLGGGQGTEQRGASRWHAGSLGGVIAALMAGLGQGCGAALSRHAQAAAVADGTALDGMTQAFIRMLPGIAVSTMVWMVVARVRREAKWGPISGPHAWPWLLAAVLCGPALGVSCFQWALSLQSSVVVLSVAATAPVLIMPMAAIVDGDRPTRLAVLGGVIAVAGVIWMLRFGSQ
jgi:drug/metabolite transporter (DMT)-like permease